MLPRVLGRFAPRRSMAFPLAVSRGPSSVRCLAIMSRYTIVNNGEISKREKTGKKQEKRPFPDSVPVRTPRDDDNTWKERMMEYDLEVKKEIERSKAVARTKQKKWVKGQVDRVKRLQQTRGPVPEHLQRALAVGLAGAPNAGKSSLVNQLTGVKVSATSSKAQTTQSLRMGVLTEANVQLVLGDAPGLMSAKKRMEVPGSLDLAHQARLSYSAPLLVDMSREFRRHTHEHAFYIMDEIDKFKKNAQRILKERKEKQQQLEHDQGTNHGASGSEDMFDGEPEECGTEGEAEIDGCQEHGLEVGDDDVELGAFEVDDDVMARVEETMAQFDELEFENGDNDGEEEDEDEEEEMVSLRNEYVDSEGRSEEEQVVDPTCILVLNKIDKLPAEKRRGILEHAVRRAFREYPEMFEAVFGVSARDGNGIQDLKEYLLKQAQPGAWTFPPDDLHPTISMEDMVIEVVREQLYRRLNKEVPYFIDLKISQWDERSDNVNIEVELTAKHKAHLAILFGHRKERLLDIRAKAARQLQVLMNRPFRLNLRGKLEEPDVGFKAYWRMMKAEAKKHVREEERTEQIAQRSW